MKVYKVGGAVRDEILGCSSQDNDYVVVGGSVDEMKNLGFKQVGKAFPVFLHPKTHEEYALARKEVKSGDKHTDFEFIFSKDVTLREDLERRDLTCNAIAYDEQTKQYIDYFGGIQDIKKRLLKHVNATHFIEDPLRILRVCRFSAQLDFNVDSETLDLCRQMVENGALKHLSSERIFEEIVKAFKASKSSKFFILMREIGALKQIMPEVDALFNTPEKEKYHPEKTTGGHVMTALDVSPDASVLEKFGILTHDLGKTLTPYEILPSHYGHEKRAKEPILSLCRRLKVPNAYKNFALASARFHMCYFNIFEMRLSKIYDLVCNLTIGHKSYLEEYITVCRADFESSATDDRIEARKEFEKKAELLRMAQDTVQNTKAQDMPHFEDMPQDEHFGEKLRAFKIEILDKKIKASEFFNSNA